MPRLSIARTLGFALALALSPLVVHAQSSLTPANAGDFMGVWTLSLESPQGNFEQELTLKDDGGKVVGDMTNQMQPDAQRITDISKTGSDLVLKFAGNFQGNAFDATITLTPAGADKATVVFDINGGQFAMNGTGSKKK